MRIFLAGATGVIGVRLVPRLVSAGHVVAGMTRSADKTGLLRDLGAEPVICDVFDRGRLREAVCAFGTECVLHELTDLPDDPSRILELTARNARIRREGTRNLLAAAQAAKASRFLAQSVRGSCREVRTRYAISSAVFWTLVESSCATAGSMDQGRTTRGSYRRPRAYISTRQLPGPWRRWTHRAQSSQWWTTRSDLNPEAVDSTLQSA